MVKIMLVDDSSFLRDSLIKVLKIIGYNDSEILEAESGNEAVEKFKQEKPDLVFSDIIMENSDTGLQTLRKIKEIDNNAKVIMVTVVDQPEIRKDAEKLGAIDYVTKPVDLDKLADAIKKALG